MRRLLPLLTLLLPYAAAGQMLDGNTPVLAQQGHERATDSVRVPLLRTADGRLLALQAGDAAPADALRADAPSAYGVIDGSRVVSSSLQYGLDPHLQVHAGVSDQSWFGNHDARVVGSEVGATYNAGRYSIGLSVGSSAATHRALPRVVPGAAPGINGLADFDSSTQLNARGRVALDGKSGIDLGASMGRIQLLPGNLLGTATVDQKALSFGVDHGPLSGTIVGRSMQPSLPGSFSADRRWNSIDLGVTWHLPWQGELSIGAQNVWSSGTSVNTPAGPEPDQSRTPYVQYHQDL